MPDRILDSTKIQFRIEAWMASDAKIEQQLPRLPQVSLMSMYRR
jgi:hypothetical protein